MDERCRDGDVSSALAVALLYSVLMPAFGINWLEELRQLRVEPLKILNLYPAVYDRPGNKLVNVTHPGLAPQACEVPFNGVAREAEGHGGLSSSAVLDKSLQY